jgi:hypothetical protein
MASDAWRLMDCGPSTTGCQGRRTDRGQNDDHPTAGEFPVFAGVVPDLVLKNPSQSMLCLRETFTERGRPAEHIPQSFQFDVELLLTDSTSDFPFRPIQHDISIVGPQ